MNSEESNPEVDDINDLDSPDPLQGEPSVLNSETSDISPPLSAGDTPPPIHERDTSEDHLRMWHIAIGSERKGLFSRNDLGDMLKTGTITTSTLVWKRGFDKWISLKEVAELADLQAPSVGELAKKLQKVLVGQGQTLAQTASKQGQILLKAASKNEILKDATALAKSKVGEVQNKLAAMPMSQLKRRLIIFSVIIFGIGIAWWGLRYKGMPGLTIKWEERAMNVVTEVLKEEGIPDLESLKDYQGGHEQQIRIENRVNSRLRATFEKFPLPKIKISPEARQTILEAKVTGYDVSVDSLMGPKFLIAITANCEMGYVPFYNKYQLNCYDKSGRLIETESLTPGNLNDIPANQETLVHSNISIADAARIHEFVIVVQNQN